MSNESIIYDKTAHLRVMRAAMKAQKKTQEDVASVLNVDRSAISRVFTGDRQLKLGEMQKIAKYLDLDLAELISSIPPENLSELSENPEVKQSKEISESSVSMLSGTMNVRTRMKGAIPEIDVLVGAGEGSVGEVVSFPLREETYSSHPVTAEWILPDEYISYELHIAKAGALIMKIVGDSMAPTYSPGDRVIVDTKQTSMTVDGVYVISDGDSPPQVKRLQRVLFTSPVEVDVVSDNQAHRIQRVIMDQLIIVGRVAGRVSVA